MNDVFGKGFLIQRCQIHKKKNVTGYVPEHMRLTIRNAMSEAYNTDSYETAKRLLLNYSWPGNFNELYSDLQRIIALTEDFEPITPSSFWKNFSELECKMH